MPSQASADGVGEIPSQEGAAVQVVACPFPDTELAICDKDLVPITHDVEVASMIAKKPASKSKKKSHKKKKARKDDVAHHDAGGKKWQQSRR